MLASTRKRGCGGNVRGVEDAAPYGGDVGDAYMRPGNIAAAVTWPGGIYAAPTELPFTPAGVRGNTRV